MEERAFALFGVLGPVIVYFSIAASIVLSPWFGWQSNALSDLGHSIKSDVAPLFNFGLFLAGFLLTIYASTVFKKHAKYSSVCLLVSAFLIQLLATFNMVYGSLHYAVAVPHFVMLIVTSIIYTIERKSTIAFTTFLIVFASWTTYSLGVIDTGIAVPETVSKIVIVWIMISGIKIYIKKSIRTN